MKNRYGFLEKKEHPWQIELIKEEDREEAMPLVDKIKEEKRLGISSSEKLKRPK